MKKAYCDFCGKEIPEEDELDLDGKNYLIPSVYRDEISVSAIEDCCLECCRKFDTFVAKLRKA